MSQTHSIPSVDPQNPFYCPALPAAAFLKSLRLQNPYRRSKLRSGQSNHQMDPFLHPDTAQIVVSSFAQILSQALCVLEEEDCANYGSPRTLSSLPKPKTTASISHLYSTSVRIKSQDDDMDFSNLSRNRSRSSSTSSTSNDNTFVHNNVFDRLSLKRKRADFGICLPHFAKRVKLLLSCREDSIDDTFMQAHLPSADIVGDQQTSNSDSSADDLTIVVEETLKETTGRLKGISPSVFLLRKRLM